MIFKIKEEVSHFFCNKKRIGKKYAKFKARAQKDKDQLRHADY